MWKSFAAHIWSRVAIFAPKTKWMCETKRNETMNKMANNKSYLSSFRLQYVSSTGKVKSIWRLFAVVMYIVYPVFTSSKSRCNYIINKTWNINRLLSLLSPPPCSTIAAAIHYRIQLYIIEINAQDVRRWWCSWKFHFHFIAGKVVMYVVLQKYVTHSLTCSVCVRVCVFLLKHLQAYYYIRERRCLSFNWHRRERRRNEKAYDDFHGNKRAVEMNIGWEWVQLNGCKCVCIILWIEGARIQRR